MRPREHVGNLLAAARVALGSRPAPREVRSLLVVGYGAIGDTIFFLPVLEALRREHPRARLVWLSNPAPVADELIPATGLADEVWRWEAQVEDPAGRAALTCRVLEADFDLAVLTPGAPAHELLAALSRVPLVAGHARPWRGVKAFVTLGEYARRALINRKAFALDGDHALARNLRLLTALGLEAPAAPRSRLPITDAAHRRAAAHLDGLETPLAALHLGPTGNQYGKMWAPERFAELSRALAAAWGRAPILVGSADEAEAENRFFAAGGVAARSLVGKTSLLETFAVLERCALVVANDTGVAKAAAALGVPTATLWGPSDPAEFRSPWDPERHLDARTGIACSPCTSLGMPARPFNYSNCGHRDCLGRLGAGAVSGAILARWPRLPKS